MTHFHWSWLLGAFVIGIVSSGLTVLIMYPKQAADTSEKLVHYDGAFSEPPASSPSETSALVDEVMKLATKVDVLDERLQLLAKGGSIGLNVSMKSNVVEQIDPSSLQHNEAEQGLPPPTLHIVERFQMQETDAAWAENMEVELQGIFLSDAFVGNASLDTLDCRTSLCKLDVSIKDRKDLANIRNELVEKIGNILPYGVMQTGISEHEVTIYLGKNSTAFVAQ